MVNFCINAEIDIILFFFQIFLTALSQDNRKLSRRVLVTDLRSQLMKTAVLGPVLAEVV